MKTKLGLAVASALLAASTGANAGIMIPAGDWTLDIGGVVNAYYTHTSFSGDDATAGERGDGGDVANITTGLLPNYLSVSGKTRQNDLDVAFTISINPGASTRGSGIQAAQQENRQAFLTFGDASWGSLAGNTTTLGRIGRGFMYADWKSQIAYSSPNWNGFQFTVGLTQGWDPTTVGAAGVGVSQRGGSETAYEGKASYAWTGDVAGKVWVSGISQNVELYDDTATAFDIGTTINVAGFGLTAYYGTGEGIGKTVQFAGGYDAAGKAVDSDQWYVQGTYALPGAGTKLGISYGESTLEAAGGDNTSDMLTFGAYHPITKHLNLVAEYSIAEDEDDAANTDLKAKTISLGAILFF